MIGWFIGNDIGPIEQALTIGVVGPPAIRHTAPVLDRIRAADAVLYQTRVDAPALDHIRTIAPTLDD